jgi:uncharacterized protein
VSDSYGSFCFAELHTSDVDGAARFYGDLLGWKVVNSPVDGYSLFQVDGKDVAGLRRVDRRSSRWIPFLSVESLDAAMDKALQFGAGVRTPAADTPGFARTSVLRDPTGASVGLWEAHGHQGAQLTDRPGTLWWAELMTREVPVAKTFYSNLAGWRAIDTLKYGIRYSVFKLGDESLAGLLPIGSDWKVVAPSYWQLLFEVDAADDRAARAKALGGTIFFGPSDIPNAGRAGVVTDPHGAVFVLMQPLPGGSS